MVRKKWSTMLIALVTGVALSAGSASAGITGYLQGDPAPGKLIPFYRIGSSLATIIGIENTIGNDGPEGDDAFDVNVHVVVFDKRTNEILNLDICLSPFDFGFIVLQQGLPNAGQQEELDNRPEKVLFISQDGDFVPPEGYVTLKATTIYESNNGSCTGEFENLGDARGYPFPLATWAILQDVGSGFFATEIPTTTAIVDSSSGKVSGGFGAFGLIPVENEVIARYDVNPDIGAETEIFVWLAGNGGTQVIDINGKEVFDARPSSITGFLDCEDELEVSTTVPLPDEVNVINPAFLAGINQCFQQQPKGLPQYRGVLRLELPDTGFIWSQITQAGQNFRENFIGYNLECNDFIFGFGCEELKNTSSLFK